MLALFLGVMDVLAPTFPVKTFLWFWSKIFKKPIIFFDFSSFIGVFAQTDAFLDFIDSNAQGNGEEVCEGYEFSQAECLAIACCNWENANDKCWSDVGQNQCWV